MTVLPIIQPSNPILRKKAIKVTSFDKKFQLLVDDMIETMLDAPGVGLAGPQIAQSKRIIVVHLPEDEEEYGDDAGVLYAVANPKIIKTSKKLVSGVEGCLSIPGYLGDVMRHEMIVVTGQDRYGKDIRIKSKGWLARVFQHEIDHLDGQLFIDIADDVWKIGQDDEEVPLEDGELKPWSADAVAQQKAIDAEKAEADKE